MAASDQLARQWGILQALHASAEGLSTRQLADRFSISKNTALRDVESLIAAGFAVRVEQRRNRNVFRLAEGVRRLAELRPTPLELLALYAARTQLSPLAGTPVFGDLMALIHKTQGLVEPQQNGLLETVSTVFIEHPRGVKSYRNHQGIIDDLVDAILRKRVCVIEYRRPYADAARTHEIRPLKLFFNRGGLYLYALIGTKRHLGTLAVERMSSLQQTRKSFRPPKGLDLRERLHQMFGVTDGKKVTVEVEFNSRAAPFIRERTWHPDQVLEPLPDGGVRWRATVQGSEEIFAWVLARGADAKLIRPRAWRAELAQRLRAAAEQYD